MKFLIQNIPSAQDPRAEIIVKKVNAFFPALYYENLNRVMRTEAMAARICDIMESDCPQTFARNFPGTTSIARASNSSSIDDGDDPIPCIDKLLGLKQQNLTGLLDGNTFGCRLLHASLATENSDHCPHISFLPEEDKNGNIKCQESKGVAASDLFTEFELDVIEISSQSSLFPILLHRRISNTTKKALVATVTTLELRPTNTLALV